MNNVSTKTGDKGSSALANGQRLDKDELVFEVIGSLDELNSWIGLVVSKLNKKFTAEKKFLLTIQHQLFIISAEMAQAPSAKLSDQFLLQLEDRSKKLQAQLADHWHTKFTYPGGSELAAWLDIARTVCRRTERRLVSYSKKNKTRPLLLKILNRLSDYLYVLRCWVNKQEKAAEKKFVIKKLLKSS